MWSKEDIMPFPKIGNLSLATNYRVTLTCISAKLPKSK